MTNGGLGIGSSGESDEKSESLLSQRQSATTSEGPGQFSFSTRHLAILTLTLLVSSHLFLLSQCAVARGQQRSTVEDDQSSLCPLEYSGWSPDDDSAYEYAPISLVIAQQLWNACQVLQLFLLHTLCYEYTIERGAHSLWIRALVIFVSAASVPMLPFSVYIISLGGHIFAALTLVSTLLPVLSPHTVEKNLVVTIVEEEEDWSSPIEEVSSPVVWKVTHEETIAFLCNLGSSLYNYNGSKTTFPFWNYWFVKIDTIFGWTSEGTSSLINDFYFAMGRESTVPLFVSGTYGSTTGLQVFLVVWSILPFLYISYFLCLYAVAALSPGTKIQRGLCIFAIAHFLFFTDVIAYRYGRGFHSPNRLEEVFHWTERWAWRIAILLPIYQNCTNGHWDKNKRYPKLGKWLKGFLIGWSVYFVTFQIVASDLVRFAQFIRGREQLAGLLRIVWNDVPLWLYAPYLFGMVIMWVTYGLIHFTGFTLFAIQVKRGN